MGGRVSDVQPSSIEPARCYLKDHQISQIMLYEISLVALYVAYCLSITTTLVKNHGSHSAEDMGAVAAATWPS